MLAPGIYRESIEYRGGAPLEIIGSGQGETVLRGDVTLANLTWTLSPHHIGKQHYIYQAALPPELRAAGVQQAFFEDEWLPEARQRPL